MNKAGRVKPSLSHELFESCFALFPSASCLAAAPPGPSSTGAGTVPEDEAGDGCVGPLCSGELPGRSSVCTQNELFVRDLGQAVYLPLVLAVVGAHGLREETNNNCMATGERSPGLSIATADFTH